MKTKKILFIDDGNVEQIIASVTQKVRREGIELIVEVINPQSSKYLSCVGVDYKIDFEKIKDDIDNNFSTKVFDIVACDFNFANDDLNGYELIRWIINQSKSKGFSFRNANFICYSSEENKFCEHIIKNEELIKLIKLNIHAFYKREHLVGELVALLKKINTEFSMSKHMQELLENEPDRVFRNIYPNFKSKTLAEIAKEIERGSHHGKEFQKYLIELTYAHILELND